MQHAGWLTHLVPGSDVYFTELVGAQMVHSQDELVTLNVEADGSIVRQSRLEQLLQQGTSKFTPSGVTIT